MLAGPVSRPRRRYLRFSVRGLIVVVFVIGAALGWIVRSARMQRDAVAAVERAGGSVGYDLGWTDDPALRNRGSWAPAWLVDTLGVDYFVGVVDASFSGNCSDRELAHTGHLSRLEQLSLTRSRISDAGLVHLRGLAHLSWIGLSDTQVTDAGLVHLKGLTSLSGIDLSRTQVTDAGLANLKGLTNLSTVDLRGTQVTDAGVNELKNALPSLTVLR